MSADDLRARVRPCDNCPWRKDAPPGEFPAERYRRLAASAYDLSSVLFACHKSLDGREVTCAGFLARGADHNLAVRLSYSTGRLEGIDRSGGADLYEDYRALAIANGVDSDDPALGPCR